MKRRRIPWALILLGGLIAYKLVEALLVVFKIRPFW